MGRRYGRRKQYADSEYRPVHDAETGRWLYDDCVVDELNRLVERVVVLERERDEAAAENRSLHELADHRRNKGIHVDRKIRESLSAAVERLTRERDALIAAWPTRHEVSLPEFAHEYMDNVVYCDRSGVYWSPLRHGAKRAESKAGAVRDIAGLGPEKEQAGT